MNLPNYSSITNNILAHLLEGVELDQLERRVLLLTIQGCTDAEIAADMGITKKWASQRVHKVITVAMNVDGGRKSLFRTMFEMLDAEVRQEDSLIEKELAKRTNTC